MPNRIIKDTIHTSDTVNQMTDFQFRLWVNLITYVDDYGRGDARPAIIKGICFPLRERLSNADISKALRELAGMGCVTLYEVDGKPYLCFPTWESHQNIRNKKSRYPGPEDGNLQAIDINCNQLQSIASNCSRNPIQSESNPNPNTNRGSRFAPPTIDEVKAYCEERKNGIDAQHFVDYYSRQGWMLSNGRKMKDWKATVRTWESREKKTPTVTKKSGAAYGGQPDPAVARAAYLKLCEELGEDPEATV